MSQDRLDLAARVLDELRPRVAKHGIDLDVTRDNAGRLHAIAYAHGTRKSTIWVGLSATALRAALRESLAELLDDMRENTLDSFDHAPEVRA